MTRSLIRNCATKTSAHNDSRFRNEYMLILAVSRTRADNAVQARSCKYNQLDLWATGTSYHSDSAGYTAGWHATLWHYMTCTHNGECDQQN